MSWRTLLRRAPAGDVPDLLVARRAVRAIEQKRNAVSPGLRMGRSISTSHCRPRAQRAHQHIARPAPGRRRKGWPLAVIVDHIVVSGQAIDLPSSLGLGPAIAHVGRRQLAARIAAAVRVQPAC